MLRQLDYILKEATIELNIVSVVIVMFFRIGLAACALLTHLNNPSRIGIQIE
jgi:hypothetical protein